MEIACRSRGTPRIANRMLRRVRDFAQVVGDGVITKELSDKALTALEVDRLGLDNIDWPSAVGAAGAGTAGAVGGAPAGL